MARALALDEDLAEAYASLGLLRFNQGDSTAAELALRLDAMDACVLGLAGCALADLGYPQRALPILRNAVEIKPANA